VNKQQIKKRANRNHRRALKRGFINRMGLVCETRVRKLLKSGEKLTRDEIVVLRRMLKAEQAKNATFG
jgi:hypothetical protein